MTQTWENHALDSSSFLDPLLDSCCSIVIFCLTSVPYRVSPHHQTKSTVYGPLLWWYTTDDRLIIHGFNFSSLCWIFCKLGGIVYVHNSCRLRQPAVSLLVYFLILRICHHKCCRFYCIIYFYHKILLGISLSCSINVQV